MSQLREALDAIMRVEFRKINPAEGARVGDFLERAAEEIGVREQNVAERERVVSAREAAAELRESDVASHMKALASMQRVRKVLDLTPVVEAKRVRWFK